MPCAILPRRMASSVTVRGRRGVTGARRIPEAISRLTAAGGRAPVLPAEWTGLPHPACVDRASFGAGGSLHLHFC